VKFKKSSNTTKDVMLHREYINGYLEDQFNMKKEQRKDWCGVSDRLYKIFESIRNTP